NAIIGKPNILSASVSNEPIAGPSGISSRTTLGQSENVNSLNEKQIMSKDSVQFASLVSNVKDILHQLDEGFIKSSLEYYNYDSAAVINAVLQDSLPPELKELLEKGSPLISNTPPTYTILREKQKIEIVSESESEDENTGNDQNGKDCFVQNPEEVRARAEQRRQMRSGKTAGNVVGMLFL
ncbi:hypothetical protein E2986_13324, partial [Frieseomelitta varia]